jgi:hypothetical protein
LDKLLVSSKITVHDLGSVKRNIQQAGLSLRSFVFIKGWFEHTLPVEENLPQKIAVLRLDGDLYSSTEVTLRYLAPRLSPGAYVIVDDYALAGAKRAVDEYFGPKDWVSIDGTGPVYLKL